MLKVKSYLFFEKTILIVVIIITTVISAWLILHYGLKSKKSSAPNSSNEFFHTHENKKYVFPIQQTGNEEAPLDIPIYCITNEKDIKYIHLTNYDLNEKIKSQIIEAITKQKQFNANPIVYVDTDCANSTNFIKCIVGEEPIKYFRLSEK